MRDLIGLRYACCWLLLAALLLGAPRVTCAHQTPRPIALWGGFLATAPRCQCVIGAAAARCGTVVWTARNACLASQLSGGTCNLDATNAAVGQAHGDAINMVHRGCTSDDLNDLGFSFFNDVVADVDTFCTQLESAAASAVYGPVLRGSTIVTVDATTQACIAATARATTKLLRFAFRARRQVLNRIATRSFGPAEKLALIDQSSGRIARAQDVAQRGIAAACPEPIFASLYHRDSGAFLATIAQRGDCLGGATYVQDKITCPSPVCGNGIREGAEQCDDGNVVGGDGCDATCKIETPAQ